MTIDVTLEEYKALYKEGLRLDDLFLLLLIERGKGQDTGEILLGALGKLRIKGLATETWQLTHRGTEVIDRHLRLHPARVVKPRIPEGMLVTEFSAKAVHEKLVAKMIALTGKKQKMIQGKYAFLCNETDLALRVKQVAIRYKVFDWGNIEKTLLQHIERSHKANWDKVMLMEYYILKNGVSKMITDLENDDEFPDIEGTKPLIDPKGLF